MSIDPFRQTGRTTRMLKRAVETATQQGRLVIVVVAHINEVDHMRGLLEQHCMPDLVSFNRQARLVKTKGGGHIKFVSIDDPYFDRRLNRYEGYDVKTPVFYDHHVHDF